MNFLTPFLKEIGHASYTGNNNGFRHIIREKVECGSSYLKCVLDARLDVVHDFEELRVEVADDGERRGLQDAVGHVGGARSHHGLLWDADRGLEGLRGRDRHRRHLGDGLRYCWGRQTSR